MNPPGPVPLEPGETILLAGGRSWHAWLYTIVFLPMACVMVPLCVLPWLFSGRYWLTQRRLIFKSPLGSPKVMALKDLSGIEVVGERSTLTVRHAGGSITLRFAADFRRLWGALILLGELPVPESLGTPQVRYRASPVSLVFPGGFQAGFGVSFNRRLVFLPNERPRSTVGEAAKVAGQLALALIGVHVSRYQAQPPYDLWLSLWGHLSTAEFDALLTKTAQARGGRVVSLSDLTHESPTQYRAGELQFRASQPLLA